MADIHTKEGKIAFVRNLTSAVADVMEAHILAGDVPDEWDGHELREWLSELFIRERGILSEMKRSQRYRDYRNTINCLPSGLLRQAQQKGYCS